MRHPTIAMALALAAACGGDEKADPTTATTSETDTSVTTAEPDSASTTSVEDSSASDTSDTVVPHCDHTGFPLAYQGFVGFAQFDQPYGWGANANNGFRTVYLQFFKRDDDDVQPTAPGTFPFGVGEGALDYDTCTTCFYLLTDCSPFGCPGKRYLATEGSVVFTTFQAPERVAVGTLNAVLREMDEDGAVIPNGETWCIDDLKIDSRGECLQDSDCTGGELCNEPWRKCEACGSGFDCSAAAPSCSADSSGVVACRDLDDCANDPSEPDDGPTAARLIAVDTPMEGSVCRSKVDHDWYRIEADRPLFLKPELKWRGQVRLKTTIWSDGVPLREAIYPETEGTDNFIRSEQLVPAGTHYIEIEALTGPDGPVPYTLSFAAADGCYAKEDCGSGWCWAGQCYPNAPCETGTFTPSYQYSYYIETDGVIGGWNAYERFDGLGSALFLTFSDPNPFPDIPGTYPLGVRPGDLNYGCKRCVQGQYCAPGGGCASFYGVAGDVIIDEMSSDGGILKGRLEDVVMIEPNPVEGAPARTWCLDSFPIESDRQCQTTEDCEGEQICWDDLANSGVLSCVDCIDNTQCSGDTPACDPGFKTCVECVVDADCRTEPVCRDNTCTVIDECVGDDDHEHLDDGAEGATTLTLGETLTQVICGETDEPSALEADWFKYTETEAHLRDFAVRWEGEHEIEIALFDAAGTQVGVESATGSSAIIRISVGLGVWKLRVRALDVPGDAPLSYTVGVE